MRMNLRSALFTALIGASLCLSAAAADETEPAAKFADKAIEATVTIDPALKTYPRLYADLLAAGKREMRKWRGLADKDLKERPDFFRDDRRYSFDRVYEERSVIGHYVSIVRSDSSYSLGAHPNAAVNTLLWDAEAGKFISIRPFFKETSNNGPTMRRLAKAVRAAVLAEKKARKIPAEEANDPMWLDSIKPDLLKIGAVALAPSTERDKSSGLLFYFSPYAVGPYVEGSYTLFVPWNVFKDDLSHEGTTIFRGERPKGDDEKDENG
jgi:Protein of unknown function (DUF3298)